VGGGFLDLEEFLDTYGEIEMAKVARLARGDKLHSKA